MRERVHAKTQKSKTLRDNDREGRRRASLRQTSTHILFNPSSTLITSLLDFDSKSQAVKILVSQIPSVHSRSISACVFDATGRYRYHTWALCHPRSGGGQIVSTMVFRRHVRVGIIELTYVASSPEYQGEGYGSFFIRSMIQRWKEEGFAYVLTFADRNAVGFFESMGFTGSIPPPRDVYDIWIDKFSESLHMCYTLYPPEAPLETRSMQFYVQVLVYLENVDKCPRSIWAAGIATDSTGECITVQYSYMLKTYTESLPIDSVRLSPAF